MAEQKIEVYVDADDIGEAHEAIEHHLLNVGILARVES